jgi:hypothetical protein
MNEYHDNVTGISRLFEVYELLAKSVVKENITCLM